MEKVAPPWTLGVLAELLNGQLKGPAEMVVLRPVSASTDDPQGISFAEKPVYLKMAEESQVGALLLPPTLTSSKPHIVVENPRVAFGTLLALADRPIRLAPGIHPTAIVDPEAEIDATAMVGAFAFVDKGAKIGPGVKIYPYAFIGEDCEIGPNSVVYPHSTLYRDVKLGRECVVHAGTVIGADGFGFIFDGKKRIKVPQVGSVTLEDRVEIGALSAIDRATAGTTEIGEGSKIDNLVQVGHNTKIGRHTVVAGLTGISGSVTIGERNVIGGGVGFADHVSTCDDVVLGGRTGVARSIDEPGAYWGTPAVPILTANRNAVAFTRLHELVGRVKALEKEIEELRKKLG